MADIKGYLKTISDGKSGETVRDAIINCMRDINEDGAVKKASLVITKPDNVTYKPGKGKAFSSVTVNITGGESDPNKTINYETMTVTELTENGTYPPEDKPDTYYSKVEVAIDWDAVGKPSNLGEEAEMVSYETDENGNKYWDASLAGYDYVKRIWIPNSVASGLPGGDYPGGSSGAGPFNVRFYDRPKSAGSPHLLKTVTGEKGGDASALYNADGRTPEPSYGGVFAGWNPPVNNVTYSLDTYAHYTASPASGSATQIPESWEQIVANSNHAGYLGKWAYLEVKNPETEGRVELQGQTFQSKVATQDNPDPEHPTQFHSMTLANPAVKFTIKMQCVALGEGGSKSTWLAMNPLPSGWIVDGSSSVQDSCCEKDVTGTDDWNSCYLHQFFEKCLKDGLPDVIKSHLRMVTKWSWGAAQYSPVVGENDYVMKSSSNYLWIPSEGEIDSKFTDFVTGGYAEKRENESAAVNYGSVWIPDGYPLHLHIQTRSMARLDMYWGNLGAYTSGNESDVKEFVAAGGGFDDGYGDLYLGFCLG